MIRYEVQLGHLIIDGRALPILVCEILAPDMATAEYIAEWMGFPEALIRPTVRETIYPEYIRN